MNTIFNLTLITIFGQALVFLISPLLAFFYTPEELGEYRYYFSILVFLGIVSNLSFDRALFKCQSGEQKLDLTIISITFSIVISILSFIWYLYSDILPWLFLSLSLIPFALINILKSYLASEQMLKKLYLFSFLSSSPAQILKFIIGYFSFSHWGLLFSDIIFRLLSCLICFGVQRSYVFSFTRIKLTFKEKFDYITLVYPGVLVNALSLLLPVYIFGHFYGFNQVAYFSLCLSLTQMPLGAIGSSISTVLQKDFKDSMDKNKQLFNELLCLMLKFSLPIPLLSFLYADVFIDTLFNSDWYELKQIFTPMALWGFFWGITSPFSAVFHLTNNKALFLKFQLIKFICRLVTLLLCAYYWDFYHAVITFVVINIILQLIQLILTINCFNNERVSIGLFTSLYETCKTWTQDKNVFLFVFIFLVANFVDINLYSFLLVVTLTLVYYIFEVKKIVHHKKNS